jgi:hypothetical protein
MLPLAAILGRCCGGCGPRARRRQPPGLLLPTSARTLISAANGGGCGAASGGRAFGVPCPPPSADGRALPPGGRRRCLGSPRLRSLRFSRHLSRFPRSAAERAATPPALLRVSWCVVVLLALLVVWLDVMRTLAGFGALSDVLRFGSLTWSFATAGLLFSFPPRPRADRPGADQGMIRSPRRGGLCLGVRPARPSVRVGVRPARPSVRLGRPFRSPCLPVAVPTARRHYRSPCLPLAVRLPAAACGRPTGAGNWW